MDGGREAHDERDRRHGEHHRPDAAQAAVEQQLPVGVREGGGPGRDRDDDQAGEVDRPLAEAGDQPPTGGGEEQPEERERADHDRAGRGPDAEALRELRQHRQDQPEPQRDDEGRGHQHPQLARDADRRGRLAHGDGGHDPPVCRPPPTAPNTARPRCRMRWPLAEPGRRQRRRPHGQNGWVMIGGQPTAVAPARVRLALSPQPPPDPRHDAGREPEQRASPRSTAVPATRRRWLVTGVPRSSFPAKATHGLAVARRTRRPARSRLSRRRRRTAGVDEATHVAVGDDRQLVVPRGRAAPAGPSGERALPPRGWVHRAVVGRHPELGPGQGVEHHRARALLLVDGVLGARVREQEPRAVGRELQPQRPAVTALDQGDRGSRRRPGRVTDRPGTTLEPDRRRGRRRENARRVSVVEPAGEHRDAARPRRGGRS